MRDRTQAQPLHSGTSSASCGWHRPLSKSKVTCTRNFPQYSEHMCASISGKAWFQAPWPPHLSPSLEVAQPTASPRTRQGYCNLTCAITIIGSHQCRLRRNSCQQHVLIQPPLSGRLFWHSWWFDLKLLHKQIRQHRHHQFKKKVPLLVPMT